jgi:Flp pilus assembly protein TadD
VRRPRLAAAGRLAAAVAALAVAGCRDRPPPPRSVLLVTIDTLRADRVGAYGGPAGLTPALDRLAGEGITFADAVASAPLTLPSHATILSGLEPPRHGVHDNGTYVFPEDVPTLATLFKGGGHATAAFVGAYVLDRRFGLARGFDAYDDAIDRRTEGASVLESERRCDAVAASAGEWLGAGPGLFFAWVHFYDPHAPYDAPGGAGRPPYDAEVAHADACLAQVVDAARRRAGSELVIAVLADHGEALGEHGESTHGFFVYQSTLRIPLIVVAPGVDGGKRDVGIARTADVLPTLARLAGIDPPAGLDGVDLLGRGHRTRESYAETVYPRTFGWAALHSYRLGPLKYIEAPRPELYDLARDPGETKNLFDTRREDAAHLARALESARARARPPAPAPGSDPEVAERLRALGYVAAGPAPSADDSARPDPKDRVALWDRFLEATAAEARGDARGAVASLRALVAEEPGNATFRRTLAAALRQAGSAREAARALGDLEKIAPDDPLAWHEAAVSAEAAGDLSGALRAARRAVLLGPALPEMHNHLGILLARSGDARASVEEFSAATRLDPNNARAWNNQANALRALGQSARAAEAYRTAARLSPRDPDPRNGLGVLAVESGDLEGAAALFREVLAANPGFHEARMNLAVVYARQDRARDARAELEIILAAKPDRVTAARAAAFLRDLS